MEERREFNSQGREISAEGSAGEGNGHGGQQGKIEDVTEGDENESDADRRYREAMEDEYAKREGGA